MCRRFILSQVIIIVLLAVMRQRGSHGEDVSWGGSGNWQSTNNWQRSGKISMTQSSDGPSDGKPKSSSQVAASAASAQVVVSVDSAVDDFQHEYDEANMQDMTLQEREFVACSRRSVNLAKSFQNWKRSQLKFLREMQIKKMFFMAWRRGEKENKEDLCMQDFLWTEDDMDHFLQTVSTFETHKNIWRQKRKRRLDPRHPHHGKPMPLIIPPSYVRLFQIILSQVHSEKFRQHFGAVDTDGTLRTPFQMLALCSIESDKVTASVASVAESVAQASKFQVRLFMTDARLAIDSRTSFLDCQQAQDLVSQVRRYRGTKLWMFVMKQVKQMAMKKTGPMKDPSPFLLHSGYQQIMGAAFKKRWQHALDHKQRPMLEKEPARKRRQAQDHEESPMQGETPDAKRRRIDLIPWYLIKKPKPIVLKKRKRVAMEEEEEEEEEEEVPGQDQPTPRSDEGDQDPQSLSDRDSEPHLVESETESASQSQLEDDAESESQSEKPLADHFCHSPTEITKTEDAELDEALVDLKPPKVAESVAPGLNKKNIFMIGEFTQK